MAAGLWILVECNIGIVSACLPVMGPLLKMHFVGKLSSGFSSLRKSNRGSSRLSDEERLPSINLDDEVRKEYPNDHRRAPRVYNGSRKNETWYSVSSEPVGRHDNKNVKVQDVETIPQGQIAVRHDVLWERNSGRYH